MEKRERRQETKTQGEGAEGIGRHVFLDMDTIAQGIPTAQRIVQGEIEARLALGRPAEIPVHRQVQLVVGGQPRPVIRAIVAHQPASQHIKGLRTGIRRACSQREGGAHIHLAKVIGSHHIQLVQTFMLTGIFGPVEIAVKGAQAAGERIADPAGKLPHGLLRHQVHAIGPPLSPTGIAFQRIRAVEQVDDGSGILQLVPQELIIDLGRKIDSQPVHIVRQGEVVRLVNIHRHQMMCHIVQTSLLIH